MPDQPEPTLPAYDPDPAQPAPVAAPAPAPARKASNGRLLNVVLGVALTLAVAGVGFAGGRLTAPASTGLVTAVGPNGQGSGPIFNGNPGGGNGGPQVGGPIAIDGAGPTIEGTVESITDTTLTVKTADGRTIQIALDGDTTYHAQTDATSSDVATGGKVRVRLDLGSAGGGTVSNPKAGDVTVVP